MSDNDLIAAMYGAIGDDARWTSVLDTIKLRLGVASAVFQRLVIDKDDLVPMFSLRDTWSTQEAERHDSWANSPLNPRFRRNTAPIGPYEIASDQLSAALTAEDREVLRHGLAACGLGPGFWLDCKTGPGEHTTIILHRHVDDSRDITDDDQQFLHLLMPHFRQVSRLLNDFANQRARLAVAEAFMDSTTLALLACDLDLGIHWMNAAAERLVDELPQVAIAGNTLRFRSCESAVLFKAALSGAGGDACRVPGNEPAQVLHLRVLRRDAADWRRGARGMVLLAMASPGTAPTIDAAEVANLFGLTMAEATLTAHLVGGMTVKDYALHRGIAEGTARMQLKSALAKAGVGRQADLVRQVCQSLARL